MDAPRRCNCVVWAVGRLARRGGYIAARRSRVNPFIPHVLWSRDLRTWWSYTAISDKPRIWWWEALWFRGRVARGDE